MTLAYHENGSEGEGISMTTDQLSVGIQARKLFHFPHLCKCGWAQFLPDQLSKVLGQNVIGGTLSRFGTFCSHLSISWRVTNVSVLPFFQSHQARIDILDILIGLSMSPHCLSSAAAHGLQTVKNYVCYTIILLVTLLIKGFL